MPVAAVAAVAAVVLSAAGTGVAVYSSIQQANAAEDAAKANSAISNANAQMAEQQAKYNAEAIRRKTRMAIGKQRAALLKSGVEISGSAEDLILNSAAEGELSALSAMYTGQVTSKSSRLRAGLYDLQAENSDGTMAATGTALSGTASVLGAASRLGPAKSESNPTFHED